MGRVGAWEPSGAASRKQRELGLNDLALIQPLAQELVLHRLEGERAASDERLG